MSPRIARLVCCLELPAGRKSYGSFDHYRAAKPGRPQPLSAIARLRGGSQKQALRIANAVTV